MRRSRLFLALSLAVSAAWATAVLRGAQQPSNIVAVAIDADDIGGVVLGPKGPEAGVWVIAETKDLLTNFIKIVVTNDQGKFLVPDLPPNANYKVWVRGYGLVDSAPTTMKPSSPRSTWRRGPPRKRR